MDYGERADLDLVEVAPNADPPVVRMMDYGKFKYQKEQARKAARKKQVNVNVREIKLRPKIGDHDFNTKRGHVERFLRGGDKVKVTIMFRGREVQHPELGERLLRSEEHTSELQSRQYLVCRLLLEKKKKHTQQL